MKKLFALLLAATMLLCTIPFVASAAEEAEVVTPISTLADFYGVKEVAGELETDPVTYEITNMITGDMNVKLTADITFGPGTTVTLPRVAQNPLTEEYEPVIDETTGQVKTYEWTFGDELSRGLVDGGYEGTFDGNGHSIVYTGKYVKTSSGGFFSNSTFSGTLKNLTLGSKENPINAEMGKASGGSNIGLLCSQNSVKKLVVENVVVYGNFTVVGTGSRNAGFLVGKTLAGASFTDVRCYGTLVVEQSKDNQTMGIGGMVGMHVCDAGDAAPIYFTNCYTDVDITTPALSDPIDSATGLPTGTPLKAKTGSGVGGLLGVNNCKNGDTAFYATNCIAVGDLPTLENLTIGAARLIGNTTSNVNATAEELTIVTDCQKPVMNAVGASIKVEDATLRFRVSVAIYNAYVDLYGEANVKVGVIVADKATATALGENFKIDATGVTNNVATEIEGGNIYATMTAANYATEYTALGYVQYTEDGTTWTTVYADAATTRSVSYVAAAALADVQETKGDGYGFETADGKYSLFTAEQQTKLASYVVASAS